MELLNYVAYLRNQTYYTPPKFPSPSGVPSFISQSFFVYSFNNVRFRPLPGFLHLYQDVLIETEIMATWFPSPSGVPSFISF